MSTDLSEFAIGYEGDAQREQAYELAERLQLPVDNQAARQLLVTEERLVLKVPPFLPMYADFSVKTWQKRRDAGKQQGLIRACKPVPGLKIVDATSGWGRDAAILASYGAELVMLERDPIMATLLMDALQHRDERSRHVMKLMVRQSDALDYLNRLSDKDYPDVIYMDPMHPVRQKSALVKKDLQILQQFIGCDEDALDLLKLAQKKALKKVVVKWPQQSPPLLPPASSITGKTVRFDIYQRVTDSDQKA
ncbi:class I SAM-dependent methyltransferase [Legionella spiritensis]|uniref:class I SAM-dependent methyltransferase n=1 Tax=Legionella spiritensis TaxID=452 RepID=UPI000F7148C6|nr:class I SAM-dependent methyltransferase [Legionella spiritensis]VEG92369.1 N6-adenine-specific methylase [Legionella spiritensis]